MSRGPCLPTLRLPAGLSHTDPPNIMELPTGAGGGDPSDSQPSRCSNAYDVAWTSAMPASADLQMNTWHSNTCPAQHTSRPASLLRTRYATTRHDTIQHDTGCYFNVRSKADMGQLNLPHGINQGFFIVALSNLNHCEVH